MLKADDRFRAESPFFSGKRWYNTRGHKTVKLAAVEAQSNFTCKPETQDKIMYTFKHAIHK